MSAYTIVALMLVRAYKIYKKYGGTVKGSLKTVGISLGIVFFLAGLLFVHVFIYPFTVAKPNFSDVEQTFNKMQFPADWQQIDSSQNAGLAGRRCPIEPESACFHKSKTFKLPASVTIEDVKTIMAQTGCSSIAVSDNTAVDSEKIKKNLNCLVGSISVAASFRDSERELYVGIVTQ